MIESSQFRMINSSTQVSNSENVMGLDAQLLKVLSDDEGLLTHCLRVVDSKFDLRWNSEKKFFFFESECKKLVLLFLDLNFCVLRQISYSSVVD